MKRQERRWTWTRKQRQREREREREIHSILQRIVLCCRVVYVGFYNSSAATYIAFCYFMLQDLLSTCITLCSMMLKCILNNICSDAEVNTKMSYSVRRPNAVLKFLGCPMGPKRCHRRFSTLTRNCCFHEKRGAAFGSKVFFRWLPAAGCFLG